MPIHGKQIPLSLDSATPTPLTPEALQAQLNDIGLTCKYTSHYNLANFIAEVKKEIPNEPDASQVWGILDPSEPSVQADQYSDEALLELLTSGDTPKGNWTPNPTALGYATKLSYIMAHFEWLSKNRPAFIGVTATHKYSERYDSVNSIKGAFAKLATNMASVVANGLDRAAIEATFSNIIAPMTDKNKADYEKTQSRVIYLVDNFNPAKDEADGIGALLVTWTLFIKDYKKKKEAMMYDTTMTITASAVQYGGLNEMNADYYAAKAHFKTTTGVAFSAMAMPGTIPPRNTKLEIYSQRPPADEATFEHSLPLVATASEAQVVVLYAPDLQNIGSIDNTKSKASTTYSKSVTSGFTFSSTQSIKIGAEFEVGAILEKAKFSMEFSLSFTETTSKSTTETMTFSVPPGERAFTYQGTLYSAVLTFDADKGTFGYSNDGKFLTEILATSATPILTSNLTPPVGPNG